MGTGSVYSQDTSWGWEGVGGEAGEPDTSPCKGSLCSKFPQFSQSLGNTQPQVHVPPVFLFNLQLYNFGGNILVPRAFYLLQPGVGGRIQVQIGTNTIHSKNANAQRTIYQVAGFHNSLKSWHPQL